MIPKPLQPVVTSLRKTASGVSSGVVVGGGGGATVGTIDDENLSDVDAVLVDDDDLLYLADHMRKELQDKIQDRRWHVKTYKHCFLYSDALYWLIGQVRQGRVAFRSIVDGVIVLGGENNGKSTKTARGGAGGEGEGGAGAAAATRTASTKPKLTAEESEAYACRVGNQLIDSGYISHVTKARRFEMGRAYEMYFFRFHDDVIDRDLVDHNLRSRAGGGATARGGRMIEVNSAMTPGEHLDEEKEIKNLWEELNILRMNVSHLSEVVISTSDLLTEANGRILILELAMLLVFAAAAMLFVGNGSSAYSTGSTLVSKWSTERWTMGQIFALFFVCLFVWREAGFLTKLEKTARNHVAILEKIAEGRVEQTSGDALVAEEEGTHDTTTTATAQQQRRNRRQSVQRLGNLTREAAFAMSTRFVKLPTAPDEERTKIKQRSCRDIPPVVEWPHRPLLVCANTPVSQKFHVETFSNGPCPIGVPFHFESELFKGMLLCRFRDVPSDDPEGTAHYFQGRQRQFQAIIQGKFKTPLKLSDVVTGHEFIRPLQRLPPQWILNAGTSLIRRKSPGVDMELFSEQPKMLAILAATAQSVSTDMPGNEPNILNKDIEEDSSMFGGEFAGGNISVGRRKKLLSDPTIAAKYQYDTESIYTFDFYQHLLNTKTYSLDLGFTKVDIAPSLNGQPIQILAKMREDGRYLWSFQIWHANLVKGKEACATNLVGANAPTTTTTTRKN